MGFENRYKKRAKKWFWGSQQGPPKTIQNLRLEAKLAKILLQEFFVVPFRLSNELLGSFQLNA
jgi:hypothetical protein